MQYLKIFFTIIILVFSFFGSFSQTIPKWKVGDIEKFIDNSEEPVIVNFWATYCGPCIEEIPYFQDLVKKHGGIKLVLVSLDFEDFYPDKIQNFAKKRKFTAPISWLDETDADYFCPKIDSAWSGVMPATLLINKKTGYRAFYEEKMSKELLEKEILNLKAN